MIFYDCATAPSPRRVRIFLAEKKLTIETVQVDLGSGANLTEAFGTVNPRRTVPVLELDDGTRLIDSNSICLFLEETHPEPNLMGVGAKERAVIAMLQREMEIHGFEPLGDCLRNSSKAFQGRGMTGGVPYAQIPELAERGRRRVQSFFTELDARLAQSDYVAGNRFTIADITALVTVDFSRAIREAMPADAHHLRRWHAAVAARPGAVR
jgi:glutathione S-transferase